MIALIILTTTAQVLQYSSFEILHPGSFCENNEQELGEISDTTTLVLGSARSIKDCAESVVKKQECGSVFFTNAKLCACMKLETTCEPDKSKTGFNVYKISDANVVPGVKCEGMAQEDCDAPCQWTNGACAKIKLSMMGAPMPGMGGLMPYRQNAECERE